MFAQRRRLGRTINPTISHFDMQRHAIIDGRRGLPDEVVNYRSGIRAINRYEGCLVPGQIWRQNLCWHHLPANYPTADQPQSAVLLGTPLDLTTHEQDAKPAAVTRNGSASNRLSHPLTDDFKVVPIPGRSKQKRPRRRHDEIDRMYACGWDGCDKAYGWLNNLNTHVSSQGHGPKRLAAEFKELRKERKAQQKHIKKQRQEDEARSKPREHKAVSGTKVAQSEPSKTVPPNVGGPTPTEQRQLTPTTYQRTIDSPGTYPYRTPHRVLSAPMENIQQCLYGGHAPSAESDSGHYHRMANTQQYGSGKHIPPPVFALHPLQMHSGQQSAPRTERQGNTYAHSAVPFDGLNGTSTPGK